MEPPRAEKERQGQVKSARRTACKEQLDREAQRILNVCRSTGQSLAIERLNTLAHLTPTGSIGGWARLHLGKRCLELAELNGVTVRQALSSGGRRPLSWGGCRRECGRRSQ